jgi:hypothetical protein
MNQGPSWVRFMKKTRGKKYRATLHNCPFKANLILFPKSGIIDRFWGKNYLFSHKTLWVACILFKCLDLLKFEAHMLTRPFTTSLKGTVQ